MLKVPFVVQLVDSFQVTLAVVLTRELMSKLVDENIGALDVPLDRSDVERISEAVPTGAGAGLRYPAPQMKGVYL